jgi:hypothetical protein
LAHAPLHVIEQATDLFALGADPGLVFGRRAFGLLPPLLGLARATLVSGLLVLSAFRGNAGGEFRHEAASSDSGDEAAQIGHRTAAHAIGLQPSGQFVKENLGLLAALVQQQSSRSTLFRQHPVRKNQVVTTTTAWLNWRFRFARKYFPIQV